MTLRIAVPNKGSLSQSATDILRESGYRQRSDSKELALIDRENDVEFFYLRTVAIKSGATAVDGARAVGVRREGVTEAAGKLQRQGVIKYSRGHITVLNRKQLEQLSCECYAVVKRETDRLLSYMSLHS